MRKDPQDDVENAGFYHQMYGQYIDKQNRGGLTTPPDAMCQWTIFGFIMFNIIKSNVCRTSLVKVIQIVADHYGFPVSKRHCMTLANIFLKNFCSLSTPTSRKESKQKIIKLS